jgi:rubrerythrin
MAMKNYMCKKCGVLVKSNSTPQSSTCPSGGTHTWRKL